MFDIASTRYSFRRVSATAAGFYPPLTCHPERSEGSALCLEGPFVAARVEKGSRSFVAALLRMTRGAQTARRWSLRPRNAREFPSNSAAGSAGREFSPPRLPPNMNRDREFGGKRVRRKRKRATRFRSRAIDSMSITNGHGSVNKKLLGALSSSNGGKGPEFAAIGWYGTRSAFESAAAQAGEGRCRQRVGEKDRLKTRIARPRWVPRD
jgi:hypothetical protein